MWAWICTAAQVCFSYLDTCGAKWVHVRICMLTPRIASVSWLLVPHWGWSSVRGGGETSGPDSGGRGSLITSPPPNVEASGASGTSTDGDPGLPPPTGVSTRRWWFWSNGFWPAHRDINYLLNPETLLEQFHPCWFLNRRRVCVRNVSTTKKS